MASANRFALRLPIWLSAKLGPNVITGSVDADLQAIIRLTVLGPAGREAEVIAVVDTGFNGFLTLPSAVVTALDLSYRTQGRAVLADGSETVFEVYEATIVWDDRLRGVPVSVADADPLVGMSLLHRHELTVQVMEGGAVSIDAIGSVAR
jgi:clan AA aspartic protease